MKEFSKILLTLVFLIQAAFAQTTWDGTANTAWYNSSQGEFAITTAEQLAGLAELVNGGEDNFSGKIVKLGTNIMLNERNWTPIGKNISINSFQGTFDGQGYTISGLSVDGGDYAGLFGYIGSRALIKNVNIVASKIRTGTSENSSKYAGGLVAYYSSTNPIENCSVKADSIVATAITIMDFSAYSGGLVGNASLTTITNSYATGNILADTRFDNAYSGGLVGRASRTSITNSYATGNVSANADYSYYMEDVYSYSGGLVGYADNSTNIINSYASGNVQAFSSDSYAYSGGLAGYAYSTTTITNSYASGNVSANYFGGIFGKWLGGTNTSVYYNSEGASQATGEGSPTGILPVSSNNLKKQATFIDWDFDNVWGISEDISYPYLKLKAFYAINMNTEYFYTGNQIKPEPTIRLIAIAGGTILIEGTDYELSYGTNKDAGTGTITIMGIGTYSGLQETVSFNIIPKKLPTNAIQEIASQTYTGSFITPSIIVKDGEITLVKDTDYEVTYSNNTNAGTASVLITGKGNYIGTTNASFAIYCDWYNDFDADSYEISTAKQLKEFAELVNGVNGDTPISFINKTIFLKNDITLTDNWIPIGNYKLGNYNLITNTAFEGIFDGQGYTISGLSVNGGRYAGLFGYVGSNGQIRNVNVVATKIKARSEPIEAYAGGLVAFYFSAKTIENCSVKADSIVADARSSSYSGGLVGYATGPITITNSYASGNVSATTYNPDSYSHSYSGGLVGYTTGITITNSYASGNVYANSYYSISGGLTGKAYYTTAITNSYASGNVYANSYYSISGGLTGKAYYTTAITNSYASGNVSADSPISSISGGLVGSATGTITITNSYTSGNVFADSPNASISGGLVGSAADTTTITNSYASGNISAISANSS